MIWLPFFIFHIWLIRRNFQTLSILGLFFRGILRNPSQLTPRRTSGLEKRHTFQKGTSWKPQKSWKLKVSDKKIHVNSIAILSHEKKSPTNFQMYPNQEILVCYQKKILTARPLKWKITFRLWSPVLRIGEPMSTWTVGYAKDQMFWFPIPRAVDSECKVRTSETSEGQTRTWRTAYETETNGRLVDMLTFLVSETWFFNFMW